MMRLEISGSESKVIEVWYGGSCCPTPLVPHFTSWLRQAAVVQGEAVITSPQQVALQSSPKLTHTGEGPVPALQHEGPCMQLNGELPQAQGLSAGCLGWVAG